ncbi:envelope stress sensor histidine kinase CpxA [Vibrio sp. V27_P1S3P104]|uniref:envelope stress sensor histidine kinase CpxA n=1 Tax=unclassified Vibrio TaxID=2614977 RepID=UPI0013729E81|nr:MULTISPECIES: envelope stress sensor histidine kinase CpxA [unclassified Vibrio]NAW70761.1 envelope stress sensor histidine kinase CpxA [Vibrio sp. V28_P6S34P95]NAX05953.1 envelope stress sensor histidine kinase CpxA [Vibrio sp. V30_P3S12P165]NAX35580.1 envelope stress sensor histidine kinase CpxA [Vibrio sp. V29_P1S30P107]NAX37774.1 envelope stress sensor histidine kinase CpxA [Vibrio sp. V27_P1S3P104]NAX40653.1 envelope stress sensor histidine kinase CpxA [Vibrio sp. V26_P1S5P106]
MRLPKINNLYGRIFAIFWLTMLLVIIAVLSLPHLDPRKSRDLPANSHQRMLDYKRNIEDRFSKQTQLSSIIAQLEAMGHMHNDTRPRFFIADQEGNILTTKRHEDFKLKALRNFTTSIESINKPQQRLYGRYMISGPVPIHLAQQDLLLYIGLRWDEPPPFLLRLFDKPLHLLLSVMLVSTPLLLWLAWALSQPAQRLASAAQRVARGEFVVDPNLERGTTEFRQAGRSFNQMVEAVNLMISGQQRLLSDISHELRSPLTRLRMANALATRKQGQSSELERIDTEAQRLERMIGELLTLSRMQTNSHLSREIQPLSSLWEAILEDAQFEAEQMHKTLIRDPIPERYISGNPKLLMSALDNVVRNAITYGTDHIEVRFIAEPHQLTITVEDNGSGVPEHELNDIFRPFYRVSTARDRHSGGTGLGLAITESAIRQHSGQVIASRSSLGGLKVQVTLPIQP